MKKQTFSLKLKKTKIVNLTNTSRLHGGTDGTGGGQTDPNNPDYSCGDCGTVYCTGTNDKTNTNRTIPTFLRSLFCNN